MTDEMPDFEREYRNDLHGRKKGYRERVKYTQMWVSLLYTYKMMYGPFGLDAYELLNTPTLAGQSTRHTHDYIYRRVA